MGFVDYYSGLVLCGLFTDYQIIISTNKGGHRTRHREASRKYLGRFKNGACYRQLEAFIHSKSSHDMERRYKNAQSSVHRGMTNVLKRLRNFICCCVGTKLSNVN